MATGPGEDKLDEYRRKRDFRRTAEPPGGAPAGGSAGDTGDTGGTAAATTGRAAGDGAGGGRRFVVQRHRARRLHYDLRLEVDGALASWAVPKGPTLDPSVRSLAVHVEDHPLEYADFEGVIPSGEYGGGDVIVWDRGTWEPSGTDDPAAAIAGGELHFDVTSDKLAGRFVLVRTGRDRDGRGREQWLLLHKNDEHARRGWDPEHHPRSVKTGRTNDEVAADPEALWRSDVPAAEAEVPLGGASGAAAWAAPTRGELAALGRLGDAGEWRLGDRNVPLAHLDAVVAPARQDQTGGTRSGARSRDSRSADTSRRARSSGTRRSGAGHGDAGGPGSVTRRDIVRHHAVVTPALLPYLAGRPTDVLRLPRGVEGRSAWRTTRPRGAPAWLEGWQVDDGASGAGATARSGGGATSWRAVLDSPAALAWMAAEGAVELRPWPSRIVDLDRPTWAVLGVEPGRATPFDAVVEVVRLVHTALDHLGLEGRPVATGADGLEVWLPVRPGPTFRQVRAWLRALARAVAGTLPDVAEAAGPRTGTGPGGRPSGPTPGMVLLDHARTATDPPSPAPWSVRAAPGAPVVVPLTWDELDDPRLRPDRWTVATARRRLSEAGDPLAPLAGRAQDLPPL